MLSSILLIDSTNATHLAGILEGLMTLPGRPLKALQEKIEETKEAVFHFKGIAVKLYRQRIMQK
jgi:hypothetical protein